MVEPAASFVPTSADADELNLIVAHLQRNPDMVNATSTVSTDD